MGQGRIRQFYICILDSQSVLIRLVKHAVSDLQTAINQNNRYRDDA